MSKLPTHDALQLDVRREDDVQVVELLLLTYRNQEPDPSGDLSVLRRKARYFDVVARLRGLSISAAELQVA